MRMGNSGTSMVLMMFTVIACISGLLPINAEIQVASACTVCKCKRNDTFVDCSYKGLTTVPKDIPKETKILNISGNQLGKLGDNLFKTLTNLEILILFNSSITQLSNGTFNGLAYLEELDLSYNEPLFLTNATTPEGLFMPLKRLKVLNMYANVGTYNNQYGYIDTQLISLSNLEKLWIDGFTQIPFGVAYRNLTSLKTLLISGHGIRKGWRRSEFCQIKNVSMNFFENLIHVQHLTISYCGMQEIHEQAFDKLRSLQYLDLSGNQHLDLPHAFKSLCHLNNSNLLTLVMNNIGSHQPGTCGVILTTYMAKCLQNIPLQELHLDYNRMSYVDFDALQKLPKSLRNVSAIGNDFELGFYIFGAFHLGNVTSIDISYQGYINEVSIWRKGNKVEYDTIHFTDPELTAKDNYDVETGEDYTQSHENEKFDALEENYHGIFSFSEHLKYISGSDKERFATKSDENGPNRIVHDHRVCPQYNAGHYIPPGMITAFLPRNLEYLDISHSRLGSPIFEMFVNDSNSVKIVNASHSMLYCWDGPIHGLTKLEYLDLSHNFCENMSSKVFDGLVNLTTLNISYNFLGDAINRDEEGRILEHLVSLRFLMLQYNGIFKIPKVFFKKLVNLETLNLRGNALETFDVEIRHMEKLQYLNLAFNRIKTLSQYTRDTFDAIAAKPGNNTTHASLCLHLKGNSLHCYCNDLDFIQWAHRHYHKKCKNTLSVVLSMCHFENQKDVNLTTHEKFDAVMLHLEDSCRSYTALIVCLSVLLAVIINIIIAVIVHRYRWRFQYWYFVVLKGYRCRRNQQRRQGYIEIGDTPEYIYDAYVASTEDQNEFIIDKLRVELKKTSLRFFMQLMHIRPGLHIADVVGNKIHESRVVVFVLSDGWSNDYEMLTAYQMWRHDRKSRDSPLAIGVKLGELHDDDLCRIREIHANVFLDYPGDENEHDLNAFWATLIQNIQSPGNAEVDVHRDDRTNNVNTSIQ